MSDRFTNPSYLNDLPVEVVIELGRARLSVADLANLDQDDVLELDKLAHECLDVVVGGRLMARGEIVMEGDDVALKITELFNEATAETA